MGWVKRKRRGRSSPPPPPPSRPGMFQPRRRNDPSFASLQQPLKQPSRATQTAAAAAAVLLVSINESKHTLPPPLQPPPQLDATQVCHRLVTELSYPEREQRETPPLPSHPTTTRSTDQEKESHPPPSAPRTITYVFSDSIDA